MLIDQPIPQDFWTTLSPQLTRRRRERMEDVAHKRTRYVRLVLADVHDPHNISAALRSAEALGIQYVDILQLPHEKHISHPAPKKPFRPSSVACGIAKWLHIRCFDSPEAYHSMITTSGYRLYGGLATTSSLPKLSLETLAEQSFSKSSRTAHSIAIVFGNEHSGIHPEWNSLLHGYFTIPTLGFCESMNVSVAAAISMHHLTYYARKALGQNYYLSSSQAQQLLGQWILRELPYADQIYQKHHN